MKTESLRRWGVPVLASCWLVACESTDPGLVEEVSKLRQENKELETRLEVAEQAAKEARSGVADAQSEMQSKLEEAQNALEEIQSRFDRKRLETSFASAVSDFKQETLKKFPDHSISQVTLHEMVMPSDHPFSSGVTMLLKDGSGASRTIHVKALGNIEGNWTFKKVEADAIASNRPDTGAPPVSPPSSPSGGKATPSQPAPQSQQVIRRTNSGGAPSSAGGKVYQIDWGD